MRVTAKSPFAARATWTVRPVRDGVAGHELRHHPVGDVVQFEAVRIADDQNEPERDPEQRRGQRLREALAKQGRYSRREEYQKRNLVSKRAEFVGRQSPDRAAAVSRDKDQDRDRYPDQEKPQEAPAHVDCSLGIAGTIDAKPAKGDKKPYPPTPNSARLARLIKSSGGDADEDISAGGVHVALDVVNVATSAYRMTSK